MRFLLVALLCALSYAQTGDWGGTAGSSGVCTLENTPLDEVMSVGLDVIVTEVVSGCSWIEGQIAMPDGTMLFSNVKSGQIMKWDYAQNLEVWSTDMLWPKEIAVINQGSQIAVSSWEDVLEIVVFDYETKEVLQVIEAGPCNTEAVAFLEDGTGFHSAPCWYEPAEGYDVANHTIYRISGDIGNFERSVYLEFGEELQFGVKDFAVSPDESFMVWTNRLSLHTTNKYNRAASEGNGGWVKHDLETGKSAWLLGPTTDLMSEDWWPQTYSEFGGNGLYIDNDSSLWLTVDNMIVHCDESGNVMGYIAMPGHVMDIAKGADGNLYASGGYSSPFSSPSYMFRIEVIGRHVFF